MTDEEAKAWRRTLAVREDCTWAIPPPPMCAAVKLLQSGRLRADAVVATVLCDTGLKY